MLQGADTDEATAADLRGQASGTRGSAAVAGTAAAQKRYEDAGVAVDAAEVAGNSAEMVRQIKIMNQAFAEVAGALAESARLAAALSAAAANQRRP
jgi:hypothetical protein